METITIKLKGRIDSTNAPEIERMIMARLEGSESPSITLDFGKLEFISSAGLRVLLRLIKNYQDVRIVDVSQEVYQILQMTGFTELMPVQRAFRRVSVEGCEEVGRGANGVIYRIDRDTVVKVFYAPGALEDIQREREIARYALILGIPTAISYEVVQVGDSYGAVFELLNARSFSSILKKEPEKMDWCVAETVKLLRKIHSIEVTDGKLPDMRETALEWARFTREYLPKEAGERLLALFEALPHDDHLIHGDCHTGNLELQNDEVLLIDMDTMSVGHPILELSPMYNSFVGFSEYDTKAIERFHGFDSETGLTFWRKCLTAYLDTEDPERLRQVEDKARIISYTRLIRRSIRRRGLETEAGRAEIELWKRELLELLERTDSLVFTCG